jgi:DNA-binding XRE family transcriptional regulator
MGTQRWKDVRKGKLSQEQVEDVRRRVADEVLEMNLRSLRESLGKTQDEIAHLADVTQSQLSKIERREDHLISTLRRYVRALGGDIEVIAVVGERRIALLGV